MGSKGGIESLLALYSDDAIIENPFISYLANQEQGNCCAKEELRQLFKIALVDRKPKKIAGCW